MRCLRRAVIGVAAMAALVPAAATAQTSNRFALGANVTSRLATDVDSAGNTHIGLQWRLGHSDQGWGFKYGLNWYSTRIDGTISGRDVQLGEVHIRPLMAGYGYTHTVRRTAVSLNLLGGYAFSGFSLDEGASALYRAISGARDVETRTANTFVVKPELSMWRDMNRKVGLHASAGYMIARPEVAVVTPTGLERHAVRADMLQLKLGVVYSLF